MSEQDQVVAVEKVERIAALENGEKVNFGARANLLSSFDTEANTITFKVFTGEVIVWDVTSIVGLSVEGLTELTKTVVLYGLLAKVRTNLAPVKLTEEKDGVVTHTLANTIKELVSIISSGKFSTRGSGDDSIELTLDQKAFATAAFKEVAFATAVSLSADDVAGWGDLDSDETIKAVSELWDSFDTSSKNAIRKNPYFRIAKAMIEIAG